MLRAKNIWVMGGDPRQAALAALLADDGHSVHTYALEQGAGMKCEPSTAGADRADCVILPLPASGQDGGLNTPLSERRHHLEEVLDGLRPGQLVCAGMVDGRLKELADARGLTLRDYFAREELPITLHDARVLVIGFGRLGKALAPRLRALGAHVWVSARRYEQRAAAQGMGLGSEGVDRLPDWLCSYDLVFNTVPAPVLGVEELAALKEGALVIDLASRPGGVDLDAAAALGVRVIWALSLPGKVAPVTAGRYIKDTVYHIMEELNL